MIARSRALDFLRRRATERADSNYELNDALTDTTASDAVSPLDLLQASQEASGIHRCLNQIDEKHREAVSLAYLRAFTHSELAARLKVPLGTVKSRICRGIEEMRSRVAYSA